MLRLLLRYACLHRSVLLPGDGILPIGRQQLLDYGARRIPGRRCLKLWVVNLGQCILDHSLRKSFTYLIVFSSICFAALAAELAATWLAVAVQKRNGSKTSLTRNACHSRSHELLIICKHLNCQLFFWWYRRLSLSNLWAGVACVIHSRYL